MLQDLQVAMEIIHDFHAVPYTNLTASGRGVKRIIILVFIKLGTVIEKRNLITPTTGEGNNNIFAHILYTP